MRLHDLTFELRPTYVVMQRLRHNVSCSSIVILRAEERVARGLICRSVLLLSKRHYRPLASADIN
jgi:hypothetical protein